MDYKKTIKFVAVIAGLWLLSMTLVVTPACPIETYTNAMYFYALVSAFIIYGAYTLGKNHDQIGKPRGRFD